MKSLSKKQIERRRDVMAEYTKLRDKLEGVLETYNNTLAEAQKLVVVAQDEFNATLADVTSFVDDIVSEMEGYQEQRSEKWLDSEAGQAYSSWLSEWQNLSIDEMNIDFPEEIEIDFSEVDEVYELSTKP